MQGLRLVFTCMQLLFQPRVGDGASFSFWEADWSGHVRFRVTNPRLHALALDLGPRCGQSGTPVGSPLCPAPSRTALVPLQLSDRAPDIWMWCGSCFSVRAVYCHIQDLESTSDLTMLLKCCRLLWKCRIPLKIKLFGWLLLRQRLVTRSFRQRFCPDTSVECPLCAGATEDCSHLFFECQRIDGMAGNTYEWSGYVYSRLILVLH